MCHGRVTAKRRLPLCGLAHSRRPPVTSFLHQSSERLVHHGDGRRDHGAVRCTDRARGLAHAVRQPHALHEATQFLQPRSWNLILSCAAIAAAVLALPSRAFLPLASPYSFVPPTTIRPIGLPVASVTAAGPSMPGPLLPDELSAPEPSFRKPSGVIT